MEKQKINQIIGQIEKSIEEIELSLNEEEFKDYCDNAYTLISYWKQQIKILSIMAKLTQEQKEHYLKNPDECPYCYSGDITAYHPDFDTNSCSRIVKCNEEDCGKKWVDVYELKGIEEL